MHLFIYIVRWALLASPLKSAPKSYLLFLIHLHPCRRKMYVVKRDGRHEMVHFDKITARLKKFSYGLSQDQCNPVLVAQKVCAGVYKGVTTSQLDEHAAETAAAMTASVTTANSCLFLLDVVPLPCLVLLSL
jgi:hypothetical protein